MQLKLRQEINDIIGDRMATHEDKKQCHFVNAFIAEALRYRGVAPIGVPHKALVDYKLGIKLYIFYIYYLKNLIYFSDEYNILKNSIVFGNLFSISQNENLFPNPDSFNPNRFLTPEGVFNSKLTGFAPFGIGRRICLGEKLALADLFLITVRILKSTSDYLIQLPGGEGTADFEPNPEVIFLSVPKPYEILLKKL